MKKAWKKPKIVEIAVGMEINSYACAEHGDQQLRVCGAEEVSLRACRRRACGEGS